MKKSRMLRNDFKTTSNAIDWYNVVDDWQLIESSFFKQYGIRLRTIEDMPWDEFCSYLAGLMPDTPLGQIVQIRSEDNEDVLKNFTVDQKRIRREWLDKQALSVSQDESKIALQKFQEMFKQFAKEGGS